MTRRTNNSSSVQLASNQTLIGKHEERDFVTALARGLDVLSCFNAHDRVLGNRDISQRCKLPKSTVSRLTHTLTRLGYLMPDETRGKYRLGNAMLSLGTAALPEHNEVRWKARTLMQELAANSKAMVALGTRSRLSMIYLETCRDASRPMLWLHAGARIPVATTAMGRAHLAAMADDERDMVFEDMAALHATGWPHLRANIEQALDESQTLGCACSFGEWRTDVNAIAVAFNPGKGVPGMVISCGGLATDFSPEYLLDTVRPELIGMKRKLQAAA